MAKKDKEIFADAERLDVVNKAPIVLCELLFDDSMVAQIKKFKRVFMRFCHENTKAQKYFMGGFEKTVELFRDKLLNKVPVILKVLYDEDIIDEESILDWAKKVGHLEASTASEATNSIIWANPSVAYNHKRSAGSLRFLHPSSTVSPTGLNRLRSGLLLYNIALILHVKIIHFPIFSR